MYRPPDDAIFWCLEHGDTDLQVEFEEEYTEYHTAYGVVSCDYQGEPGDNHNYMSNDCNDTSYGDVEYGSYYCGVCGNQLYELSDEDIRELQEEYDAWLEEEEGKREQNERELRTGLVYHQPQR